MAELLLTNTLIESEKEKTRLEVLVAKETDFGAFQVFARDLLLCNSRSIDWVIGEARRRFCRAGGYAAFNARLSMLKSQMLNATTEVGKSRIVRQSFSRR